MAVIMMKGWCKLCGTWREVGFELGRCLACGSPHICHRRPDTDDLDATPSEVALLEVALPEAA